MLNDDALIARKFSELSDLKSQLFDSCDKKCHHGDGVYANDDNCECQRRFQFMIKFIKSGIPITELQSHMDSTPAEKMVREVDPTTMVASEPFKGYAEKFHAVSRNIGGKVVRDGYSFLFFGANGSGKTHTATYLASCAIDEGLSTYYIYFKDLYNLYNKVEYKEHDRTDLGLLEYIMKCDFLVVDELGKESNTEPFIAFLELLLKKRQSNGKSTTIVTNLDLFAKVDGASENEVLKRYGNSVWDLFKRYFVFQFASSGNFRAKTRRKWEI